MKSPDFKKELSKLNSLYLHPPSHNNNVFFQILILVAVSCDED